MAYKQLKLWFDRDLAVLLADKLLSNGVQFDKDAFVHIATQGLDDLELKGRVEYIADALYQHLPFDYQEAISRLVAILGPENEKETGMFKEFYWVMPIAKYVEKYGLVNFDVSMHAIYEITKRNTGEYTIRPFLEKRPQKTLSLLEQWAKDPNKHVRRLASEGVRPRLPWAGKLDQFIQDPTPILPILENLKDDPSKYVQKSVANCINDVLKDNPKVGKTLIESWATNSTKERKWIIKHALRNLVKANEGWAVKIVAR
ncbi:DNA alkylation repair protein [Flavobacteriaceae bacterium GF1]